MEYFKEGNQIKQQRGCKPSTNVTGCTDEYEYERCKNAGDNTVTNKFICLPMTSYYL